MHLTWRGIGGLALLSISVVLAWRLTDYDLRLLTRLPLQTAFGLFFLAILFSWLYGVGVSFLLRSVGVARPIWKVFWVVSAGGTASYLGNIQLGIPVRVVLFRNILSVPVSRGTASVTLESACWFALMGAALMLAGTWTSPLFWCAVALIAVGAWTARRCGIPISLRFVNLLPAKVGRFSLRRLKETLKDLAVSLTTAHQGWILCCLITFAINYAIDATTICIIVVCYGEWISPWKALNAVVLSYLAGLVSMIPMGLGVRDVSLVALMAKAGVSLDTATTTAILHRLIRTIVPLIIGFIALNVIGAGSILKLPASRDEC